MDRSPSIAPSVAVGKADGFWQATLHRLAQSQVWHHLRRDPLAVLALIVLTLIVISAALAPVIAPHDPVKQDLDQRLLPPRWLKGSQPDHLLGTDQLGRDLFSRIIHGGRVSLVIGILAVFVSGIVGVLLGLLSGFHGGVLDAVLMAVVEIQSAFPFILLAIAIIAVLGTNLVTLLIVVTLSGWVIYARVVRAQVLSLRQTEFVDAARVIGCTSWRILLRHILPQLVAPISVMATLEVARIIVLESSLSFLGLGVQPPSMSWGQILGDGRMYLTSGWAISVFSGTTLLLAVLSINIVGESFSEIIDPALRRR